MRLTGVPGVNDELVVDVGLALPEGGAVDADFSRVAYFRLSDVDLER